MADLLIFDKDNFMDAWTPEELANRIKDDPEIEGKYKRRYQRGDIVERREDGYWTGIQGKNFSKSDFCVINISDNDMIGFDVPLYDALVTPEDTPKILKKRKYNIDTSNIIFTDKKAGSTYANLNLTVKEELKKDG